MLGYQGLQPAPPPPPQQGPNRRVGVRFSAKRPSYYPPLPTRRGPPCECPPPPPPIPHPTGRAPRHPSPCGDRRPTGQPKKCQHPGCERAAAAPGNLCKSHGGGRRCQWEGCTKSAAAPGHFCMRHGGGRRCQFKGCDKAARAPSHLCKAHGGGIRCQHEGCLTAAQTPGKYCVRHGGGRRCRHEGCDSAAKQPSNYCPAHGGGWQCKRAGCGTEGLESLCARCTFWWNLHVQHGAGPKPGTKRLRAGEGDACPPAGAGPLAAYEDAAPGGVVRCAPVRGRSDVGEGHGGGGGGGRMEGMGERAHGRQRQQRGWPGQPAPSLPGASASPAQPASGGGCLPQPRWAVCATGAGAHQGQTGREAKGHMVDGPDSVFLQGTWASRTQKHSEAGYGRPVDRGVWTAKTVKRPRRQPAHPQYANYWALLTRKRHIMPHSAQPQHTNYWAPRTRKRRQQEHRPQRPTESSNPMQHAKGRTGDRPGPRKGTTTRRNVTQGGGGGVRARRGAAPAHACVVGRLFGFHAQKRVEGESSEVATPLCDDMGCSPVCPPRHGPSWVFFSTKLLALPREQPVHMATFPFASLVRGP